MAANPRMRCLVTRRQPPSSSSSTHFASFNTKEKHHPLPLCQYVKTLRSIFRKYRGVCNGPEKLHNPTKLGDLGDRASLPGALMSDAELAGILRGLTSSAIRSNTPSSHMSGEQSRDTPGESSGSSSQAARDRKGGLSCAECRRSKLKCDRNVPCQACVRRGCAAICPDGTLMATKGNKVLQARAEKLGEQVKIMTAKITELEKQLAESQQNLRLATSSSAGTSRILESASREPDAPPEDQLPNLVDAVGSLAINIHTEGGTKYYGSTSSSEYLSTLLPGDGTEGVIERLRDPKYLGVPEEILQLVYAFPLGIRDCPYDKSIFLPFFPSRDKARELSELYYLHDAWQFYPVLRKEFNDDVLEFIYGTGYPIIDSIHPHKLSVFFSIMAQGMAFSRETSASLVQEQYHALACALISLEPITRGVTCSTVQAFFLIVRFLNTTVRTAGEDCWILFGICVRVSQVMGLQYDGSAWDLDKDEIQRRRAMFWEIYTWSSWNAFIMGRPPSIYLEDTDCKFPDNDADESAPTGELGFHAWKFRYTAACLPWTLKHAFSPGSVSYEVLMELDRKIRTFPIPSKLQVSLNGGEGLTWSANARLAMQQCNAIFMKEANLLYLHRGFFAIALRDDPINPIEHRFGPSVVASYRSARRMCVALRGIYLVHAETLSRFWYFWSCIFSSCIVLSALVYGSPGCSFAQEALMELNNAAAFYEEGSALCRPPKSMYVLAKLKRRAREAFTSFHAPESSHGVTEAAPNDWSQCGEALQILGGYHGVVRHPTYTGSSPTSHSSEPERNSQSPKATHPFSLGPATSYERARDPPMSGPSEMESIGSHIPMQYDDAAMHSIASSSMPQASSFVAPGDPGPVSSMVDQTLSELDAMAYYDYNLAAVGAPSPVRVQVSSNLPNAPSSDRRHIWKSFIEGLMDDSAS